MGRDVVFEALTADPVLNGFGINSDSVFHNYSLDERPVTKGPFIILRWSTEDTPRWANVRSPARLILWSHWPVEETNDFSKLDAIVDACDDALKSVEDVSGTDGYAVTCVRATGRSGDFKDDGFNTISKNAGYEVLARRLQ